METDFATHPRLKVIPTGTPAADGDTIRRVIAEIERASDAMAQGRRESAHEHHKAALAMLRGLV